jgi:tRNA-dihydrouridine synthase B
VSFLNREFKLGKLTLPSNIFCAPLAGCSDLPFRRMTSRYRPGLIFCEMVKMEPLVRKLANTYRLLEYEPDMHPIGAQICGSKPELAGPSAKIIEDLGFDTVDLNCGCPVDKVTKDGSGSGMLKNPQLIGEVIANMVAAVKIPVTVKIRAGWDIDCINAVEVTRIAEQAGAVAICIHGRTREQGYSGSANWDWIKACKEVAKNIVVIGNGDLFTAASVEKMFQTTGCDAVLISRGTMGQPWIVEDVYRHFSGEPPLPRNSVATLLEHMEHVISYQVEKKAVLDMRRIGCWYLKNQPGASKVREAINRSETMDEIRSHILGYSQC